MVYYKTMGKVIDVIFIGYGAAVNKLPIYRFFFVVNGLEYLKYSHYIYIFRFAVKKILNLPLSFTSPAF